MIDRRRALALGVVGLALQGALSAGALGGVAPTARLLLAFGTLILLPGFAIVRLTGTPPGGAWLAAARALGFGVAWNGALVMATRAIGQPFTVLAGWPALAATVLLWGAALRFEPRDDEVRTPPLGPGWGIAILVAFGLALWHGLSLGPPMTYYSDSPDHVGTIRRMLASGDAFPRDAFFRDAGVSGVDPRKGLWHPQVALIAKLAAVDPLPAWRGLTGALAALFVLAAASLGVLIGGGPSAAVAAWALLLTYGASLTQPPLREAVFATKLADQLALTVTVAMLADLGSPGPRTRLAAVVLALGAVAAHVFSAIQFAIVFTALGLGLLARARRWTPELSRLTVTSLAIGAVCLPYLLWRAHGAYAPVNAIHTEAQGLLFLWGKTKIVSPGVLWDWMGPLWLLFPLAWSALWNASPGRPAVLFVLTTSLGVALLIFNPLAVGLLEPRVGYLLLRMIWMVPLAGLLGWLIPHLVRRIRSGAGRARLAPSLKLAGVAFLLLPALGDGAEALLHPQRLAGTDHSSGAAGWSDGLRWMNDSLATGRVVLSDPATSYMIPMTTRHYVVTLVDQHSSPNDSLALTRLLDARDALDPFADWSRTRDVIHRYEVNVVVLNDRFESPPHLDYWTPRHDWFTAARGRLDAVPGAFRRVFDRDGFVVYTVDRGALDSLSGPPAPRASSRAFVPGQFPIARRIAPDVPALVSLRLGARWASPGDTLHAVAQWRALEPLPAGSYEVAVRFDRALPGGITPPAWIGKPSRKVIERLRGERYRFRLDHLPAGGEYGVDLWRPDEVVRDSFEIVVPRDVAPGYWTVRIRMIRQPHYPNYRLSDYFFDDDYYTGIAAGTLVLARDGEPLPPAPTPPGGH